MGLTNNFTSYSKSRTVWKLKWIFRNRVKVLAVLVFIAFLVVCIGPIFFLPHLKSGISSKAETVYNVYKQMQKAAPELIIPPPPLQLGKDSLNVGYIRSHDGIKRKLPLHTNDIHLLEDRLRLQNKINNAVDPLEKPFHISKPPSPATQPNVAKNIDDKDKQVPAPIVYPSNNQFGNPVIQGGEDSDPEVQKKRNKVKEMALHAWRGYKAYAWGKNELKPISKRGHSSGIFGRQDMGATIIDALDTLYIMGLMEEYNEGREWVKENLDFNKIKSEMSVFETNIRFVGGLLTMYSFTDDPMFRDKALHVANKLLPAFESPTGLPFGLINVANGIAKNYAWASGGSTILSEAGTLHLEFVYLSAISGNPIYKEKVMKIRDILQKLEKPNGLYPNYINPKTGKWGQRHVSIGALGDSYYEYLLKAYVQSGGKDTVAKDMYSEAIAAVTDKLIMKSRSGLTYIAESKFDRLEHKMDHLACFSAGMYAIGAHVIADSNSEKYHNIGAELANTCHESYARTQTGLGPESFRFSEAVEARALKSSEKYYILRPEVIEGWFYMWRYTHDNKYRDWAWDVVQALEKYCRVEAGFSGIQNVYSDNPTKDDVQQSFFFAETLKYLYLIFSDDSLLNLDEWVFNTEAHPLPVLGKNSFYRLAKGANPIV